jgi:hypothetical protein
MQMHQHQSKFTKQRQRHAGSYCTAPILLQSMLVTLAVSLQHYQYLSLQIARSQPSHTLGLSKPGRPDLGYRGVMPANSPSLSFMKANETRAHVAASDRAHGVYAGTLVRTPPAVWFARRASALTSWPGCNLLQCSVVNQWRDKRE